MASNSSAMPNSAAVQIKCDIRVDVRLDEAMLNEFFIVNESARAIRVERARGVRLLQRFRCGITETPSSYRALRNFWGD
jgi:hypothetical protein